VGRRTAVKVKGITMENKDDKWLDMEDAPYDGTEIIGLVNGEPWLICWAEERR